MKKLNVEFMEYFSFGKYLDLHQRVEYLEEELDRKEIVKKRHPHFNSTLSNQGRNDVDEDEEIALGDAIGLHMGRSQMSMEDEDEMDQEDDLEFKSFKDRKSTDVRRHTDYRLREQLINNSSDLTNREQLFENSNNNMEDRMSL